MVPIVATTEVRQRRSKNQWEDAQFPTQGHREEGDSVPKDPTVHPLIPSQTRKAVQKLEIYKIEGCQGTEHPLNRGNICMTSLYRDDKPIPRKRTGSGEREQP